jgi:uncharacterized protein YukE
VSGTAPPPILTVVAALQTVLVQLETELARGAGGWPDEARRALDEQRENWRAGITALQKVLRNVVRAVGDAAENFHSELNSTANVWK